MNYRLCEYLEFIYFIYLFMSRQEVHTMSQARNQGDIWGISPPEISKHCIAIFTFAETLK